MRATIEVKDRKEAEHIRTGLDDAAVRAFVVIVGVLKAMPTDRSRARVLTYVNDLLNEQDELARRALETKP